jgi:hypothetical protein
MWCSRACGSCWSLGRKFKDETESFGDATTADLGTIPKTVGLRHRLNSLHTAYALQLTKLIKLIILNTRS